MTTDFSKASQQPSQLSSKNKSGLPVCIMANLFLDKRLQSIVCKGGKKNDPFHVHLHNAKQAVLYPELMLSGVFGFFSSSPPHMARRAAKDPEQEWRAMDYKKGGTELFTL